jgi:hypothetical protein
MALFLRWSSGRGSKKARCPPSFICTGFGNTSMAPHNDQTAGLKLPIEQGPQRTWRLREPSTALHGDR